MQTWCSDTKTGAVFSAQCHTRATTLSLAIPKAQTPKTTSFQRPVTGKKPRRIATAGLSGLKNLLQPQREWTQVIAATAAEVASSLCGNAPRVLPAFARWGLSGSSYL